MDSIKDCYALNNSKPIIDKTRNDWFPLNGREENGWTIIQLKRLLNTCDQTDIQIKVIHSKNHFQINFNSLERIFSYMHMV